MRGTGHVARMGAMRNAYTILAGKRKGKKQSEDVDGRIMLE